MEKVEELIEKLMEYSANNIELFQQDKITHEELERRLASVHLELMQLNKDGVGV